MEDDEFIAYCETWKACMMTQDEKLKLAREIVADNIDRWGWGPLEGIEGLSEHKLAVDAALAAIEATEARVVEYLKQVGERQSLKRMYGGILARNVQSGAHHKDNSNEQR